MHINSFCLRIIVLISGNYGQNYRHHKALSLLLCLDRAIAQAVSRRLPTTAARGRAPSRLCGICGGQSIVTADKVIN
jgi:hypothetical protein